MEAPGNMFGQIHGLNYPPGWPSVLFPLHVDTTDCQEVNRHSCRKAGERGRRNTDGSSMHVEQQHKNILLVFGGGTI